MKQKQCRIKTAEGAAKEDIIKNRNKLTNKYFLTDISFKLFRGLIYLGIFNLNIYE